MRLEIITFTILILKRKNESLAQQIESSLTPDDKNQAKKLKTDSEDVKVSGMFSPCNIIFEALSVGRMQKFCIPKTRQKVLKSESGAFNSIEWAPSKHSHLLATANMNADVAVWNCVGSDRLFLAQRVRNHTKAVKDVAWSACERLVLSCSYDGRAVVADVETGKASSSDLSTF